MIAKILAAAGALFVVSGAAQAQTAAPTLSFDRAVFITCKEAHALQPEARKALAYYLAEYSARYRGVTIPDGPAGAQVGYLVRGGCTLSPDAYLFAVIDRAILAEMSKLPKR